MRKKAALFLGLAMLVSSLAGCSSSPKTTTQEPAGASTVGGETSSGDAASEEAADGPGGKINIWVWSDYAFLADAYMKLNPNAEIEYTVISSGDYLTKIDRKSVV